ncbi:GNAT family N-acetyltransferase [Bradyrhizobium erythrophlei]|uniref:Acetyltransferase (GNAT) family protein n=1 Tax=Bradyrhizobium erythrophlei TaxID=1437360 RepID=A0A1M7U830_9BRAD|nr:GNAT family N-acetyltransferase [Bradyrhizobium erythrophlei]SHN79123.1 Acetyltransferase (GNAT) family protein [Bradyrhizobium erythrophlei]
MSEDLSFRRAQEDDFAAVRGLAEQLAAHIEEPPPPLTLERYLTFYVRDHAPMHLVLAERGGRVVGMIAWVLTHELYSARACVYVSDIAVHAEARGQGVGKALMAQAKAGVARKERASLPGMCGTATSPPGNSINASAPPSIPRRSATS